VLFDRLGIPILGQNVTATIWANPVRYFVCGSGFSPMQKLACRVVDAGAGERRLESKGVHLNP
jgi:hypothetical protein